jgi:hypothetical protein
MSAEIQKPLRAKALEVYEILIKTYGEHPLKPRREPMYELISMIPIPASASRLCALSNSPVFRHHQPNWLDTSCTMS